MTDMDSPALNQPQPQPHQFSGHETFPLRQLWLKKAYDAVAAVSGQAPRTVFAGEDAIVRFGVGKNMAMSIRYWANACNVIAETREGYYATELGAFLFSPETGHDVYTEQAATAWLVHWQLASTRERTTTWWFLFNHVVQQVFDRDHLVKVLQSFVSEHGLRISTATLRRDVECCIRSYVPRLGGDSPEEMSEPLLGELGLIQQNAKGTFEFRRGAKKSLPDGVFAYALLDYWSRMPHAGSVMAFDRVAHDYGSPGRVFKLDENAVADRLIALETLSKGNLQWVEQAGIRQVTRRGPALHSLHSYKIKMLETVYG